MKILAMSRYSDFEKVFSRHARTAKKIEETALPRVDLSPLYSGAKLTDMRVTTDTINAQNSQPVTMKMILPIFQQFIKLLGY